MYKVEFSNSAAKDMNQVYIRDRKLYGRFVAAVDALSIDPFCGKKLKGPLKQDYSLRVGDYRIVYIIYKEKLMVYIIDLGHRRDIYR